MSSREELHRVAIEAQEEIARHQRLRELGEEALRTTAAARAERERLGKLGKFTKEISKRLFERTSDQALMQAASQGQTSVFVPVERHHPVDRSQDPTYLAAAEKECATRAQTLRENGYAADLQVRPLPTRKGWYGEDAGHPNYPDYYDKEDWVGVEVRW